MAESSAGERRISLTVSTRVALALCLAVIAMAPRVSGAQAGVYDDCINLHAREIAHEVNKYLAMQGSSCPPGGPVLDAECLDDCGGDALDFAAAPGLASVPVASGCDGLTANGCADEHYDNPTDYLTGDLSKSFQYRLVPLCVDGSGDHDWQLGEGSSAPTCDVADRISCVDGTRAIYWGSPSDTGGNFWIVRFSGGHGACKKGLGLSAAEACWQRIEEGDDLTGFHSKKTRNESGLLGDQGYIDTNRVFIDPCSEDRYTGDQVLVDQPIGGGDSVDRLPLVGRRVVKAVLSDLVGGVQLGDSTFTGPQGQNLRKTLPDFGSATRVVLAGSSAGAIGLSFMLDIYAADIAALNATASVRGFLDSRLMPSLDNEEADFEVLGNGGTIYGGHQFDLPPVGTSAAAPFAFSEGSYEPPDGEEYLRYGPDSWNTPDHDDCWATHGPTGDGRTWRCRDQAHVVFNHIETPVFIAHSLRDSNQADAPIEWTSGLQTWEGLGNAYCARQRAQLDDYATLRSGLADGAAATAGPIGVWAPNFSWHELFKDDCAFSTLALGDGVVDLTLKEAFASWLLGNEVVLIDGLNGATAEFRGCVQKSVPLSCPAPSSLPALRVVPAALLGLGLSVLGSLALLRKRVGNGRAG